MSNPVDSVLTSSLIQKEMPFRLILPKDYAASEKRYPVLYLLHGLSGSFDNWTDLTGIVTYAVDLDIIIVMPEGGDGWYADSVEKYESYLIAELLPEIDGRFRTIADRRHRAIAGNSMGGYGAFKFALKFPELFAFAASFSGAFHAPTLCGQSPGGNWNDLGPSITSVFGDRENPVRMDNNLAILVARKNDRLPYFYFDCGSDDGFISANREMDKTLLDLGVPHEFHELEGGHDWKYWDWRVRHLLEFVSEKLGPHDSV